MSIKMNQLVNRARALVKDSPGRAIVGVCGAPGSGKSTFAAAFASEFGASAVVVPMDGFHLHDDELQRMGLSQRKGAPATFDVYGYLALLTRLRAETSTTVYAARFERSLETCIAGAVAIRPEHQLVVTEGNYLLHDAPPWRDIASLLNETWYIDALEELRVKRLVQRHMEHGKSRADAVRWVAESDQSNACLVARTRSSADLILTTTHTTCRNSQ